jgi:hypothetical protein
VTDHHGVLLVQTEPKTGHEQAFDDFYDSTHMAEILQTPGFVRARRYRAVRSERLPVRPDAEWPSSLAIYDIVSRDLVESYGALLERVARGALTTADVFSAERPYRSQLFERVVEL